MTLPQEVIEQQKEAEEIFKQMYGAENADGKSEETPSEEKPTETPEPVKSGEETPESEAKPDEAAPAEEAPKPDAEFERVQNAYRTLQGKYNAEVPRQAEQIKALRDQIAALEARTTTKPSQVEDASPVSDDLTDVYSSMENDFGKDFAANFRKAVKVEAKKIATETFQGVRGEVEGIGKAIAKTREDKFLEDLTRLQPNWRESYADPGFVEMLGEVEPLSGKPLGDLAQEANNAFDSARLARIYALYDQRKTASKPAKVTAEPAAKPSKEHLVSPAASGKATVSGGEKPDYVNADEIESFYRDSALGKWADRPKAKAEMEARINKAISNNWVIGG